MLKKINFLYNFYKYKTECDFFDNFSEYINFEPIKNSPLVKCKSISFIIPGMTAYSGGHTSILRLGTLLSDLGYQVNYISYIPADYKTMYKNARINLANFKGKIYDSTSLFNVQSDVCIATFWEAAYYVKKMAGYKMYFVQDFEPYFYTFGEKYLLAQKSYELGLHLVSLGKWNKHIIEKNCTNTGEIDCIDFPYSNMEYKPIKRDFSDYYNKKEFNIAVYVKSTAKRAPFILQNILGKLKDYFYQKNIKLNIFYFGEDKLIKLKHGKNLGKLSKSELFELYKNCDFGMVASLTNISLVPYEMMATGLPIIEFKEGSFEYFFKENTAILTSLNWKELLSKLEYLINNPYLLEEISQNASEKLRELSWEKTAQQFDKILQTQIRQDNINKDKEEDSPLYPYL